jgi:hypothetical protein
MTRRHRSTIPLANALRIHESDTPANLVNPLSPHHGGDVLKFHRRRVAASHEGREGVSIVYGESSWLLGLRLNTRAVAVRCVSWAAAAS